MQKPTPCIYVYTRAYLISRYTRAYKYTSQASTTALFSKTKIEISQVSRGQKQALANAFIICLQSHPRVSTQTPKRGTAMQKRFYKPHLVYVGHTRNTFAGAKVLLFFDIRKF